MYCLLFLPLFVGVLCFVLALVFSNLCPSFAILLMGQRELIDLLLLSSWCLVTVSILWLFLTVPWVGLQCVIVVFPDLTHLLFSVIVLCLF